jgi:predicted nucleic acid-binding protein
MKAFFDANVLVDAFDRDSPAKSRRAQELMRGHVASGGLVLSIQVLQEFYVAVTRKLARPLPEDTALAALQRLAALPTVQVDTRLVLEAARRSHPSGGSAARSEHRRGDDPEPIPNAVTRAGAFPDQTAPVRRRLAISSSR